MSRLAPANGTIELTALLVEQSRPLSARRRMFVMNGIVALRNKNMRSLAAGFIGLGIFLDGPSITFGATAAGMQTLNVSIGPIGKLAVVQPSVSLTHTGGTFAYFTGSSTIQYKVRTTISTGSSSLTINAASEFSPSTGPKVANSDLTYTCSGATLGVGCSGTQTVSTSSQTGVVTVGSGACTGTGCVGANPNSVTLNLNLVNSPVFKTASYSTNLTFTISGL